jgi:hypothetical protein
MSKKMNKLVLLSALMVAIIGTFGTVSAENLIADGGSVETAFTVGQVEVTKVDNNLHVVFSTEGDWELTETHLQVAASVDEVPQTNKGNPKVGKFDFSSSDVHEYIVPIPDGCDSVIIAAHAAVQLYEGVDEFEQPIFRYESAWGEGDEFNDDRNWAMYFTYIL